jgi:hypothetical protein
MPETGVSAARRDEARWEEWTDPPADDARPELPRGPRPTADLPRGPRPTADRQRGPRTSADRARARAFDMALDIDPPRARNDNRHNSAPRTEPAASAGARPGTAPRPATVNRASAPSVAVPRGGVPGRRTVTISGHGSERYQSQAARRRPPGRAHERPGFKPDRVAMWAVLLGFALVLIAATSSHAAMLIH